ncbi:MAG TPA: hypothetical protein PLR83_06715, partial [Pyrinomonadaceae bacterium]|nr:hypothetical protein [Pyrinomonadaceae bacterium]
MASLSPDRTAFRMGSADSPAIELSEVTAGLRKFAADHPNEPKVAYIAAESRVPQEDILNIIRQMDAQGYEKVRFLVGSIEKPRSNFGKQRVKNGLVRTCPSPKGYLRWNL